MCTSSQIIGSLLVLSVLEIGLGVSSVAVGAVSFSFVLAGSERSTQLGDSSPVWSGVCFLLCGVCGIFCAKKKSGLIMILFSACCICGLIGGILNFQFLRALTKKSSALYPLYLTSMSLACIGIGGCTLSSWLTCRLASYEQRRMFSEREHSLHHSHEMAEKRLRGIEIIELPSCPVIPPTPELPPRQVSTSPHPHLNQHYLAPYLEIPAESKAIAPESKPGLQAPNCKDPGFLPFFCWLGRTSSSFMEFCHPSSLVTAEASYPSITAATLGNNCPINNAWNT